MITAPRKRTMFLIGGMLLLVVLTGMLAMSVYERVDERYRVSRCEDSGREDIQFDCWFSVIRYYMKRDEIERAMRVFKHVYTTYPRFYESGCHQHAHRVGDMAYYELFRGRTSLDDMRFPQEVTACGYGFFHGFFEHYVQDNPDGTFIEDMCADFEQRLSSRMGSIRSICYHGAGHGLMLATAQELGKSAWGNPSVYFTPALKVCDAFTRASTLDRRECRDGIFNVMVDWMVLGNYGLSFDPDNVFELCRDVKDFEAQRSCYNETAQKLDRVANFSPVRLYEVIQEERVPKAFQQAVFSVGMPGMLQPLAGSGEGVGELASECHLLKGEYRDWCITSIVGGLYEHGIPQEEYKAAFNFCKEQPSETAPVCWKAATLRAVKFYGHDGAVRLCKTIPEEYHRFCDELPLTEQP
jgi:hypothetical protein